MLPVGIGVEDRPKVDGAERQTIKLIFRLGILVVFACGISGVFLLGYNAPKLKRLSDLEESYNAADCWFRSVTVVSITSCARETAASSFSATAVSESAITSATFPTLFASTVSKEDDDGEQETRADPCVAFDVVVEYDVQPHGPDNCTSLFARVDEVVSLEELPV